MANRPPVSLPKLSRRSRILLIIAGIVIAALLLGAQLLDTYVNWLWFGSVGARGVFSTVVLTRIGLFFAAGLLVGGLLAVSLMIAYRTRPVFVPVSGTDDPLARYRSAVSARVRWFGIGIPLLVGIIAGATAQNDWKQVQLFFNGTEFGVTDPEFGLDIGFFAFDLPFYNWLLGWLFVAIAVAFFGGLLAHYLFGGIRLAGRGGQISGPARVHLLTAVGLFVLLKAAEYFFDRYNLLLSDRNDRFTGATYTDLNAVLPAQLILLFISAICAIAFFAGAFLRNLQLPAIALVLLILSGILVGFAWPQILQQFSVRPNENQREAQSIQRNMDATRKAFGLTDVNYQEYEGKSTATPAEVRSNKETIENIRLLDPQVLESTFTQRLGVRNFYGFPEGLDVDRYRTEDGMQSYIVAAKELNSSRLAGNQQNWINRHMVYTHGNGFVAAPANKIDRAVEEGGSDGGYPIIGTSNTEDPDGAHGIKVDEPRIYFGELITDYSIVGGDPALAPGEYDTDTKREYRYQGDGGVPIDNWINRLVFAAKYGEQRILFSDAISEGSRMMWIRDPRQRVEKMAPWLTVDGDPYPAVVNGRVKWIVDGYTTLNNYPYAQKTQLGQATQDPRAGVAALQDRSINYIRNSVKATVDAYSGKVTLYSNNDEEPVLKAWRSVFPGLVQPEAAIPDELRAHFRYPNDLFKVQREMIGKYHVDGPQQFYANQNFWNVPPDPTQEGVTAQSASGPNQPPYYVFAQLPGANKPTFQLFSTLTPLNRQTLASWVSVSSEPGNYGQITVLELPNARVGQVDGPVQVQNRFQTNPEFAEQRTLLGNQNVQIINGNLLTLPVAKGFIYVEPIYIQQRSQNSYPQLARVLVSYGSSVGFAPTLNQALDEVFGEGTGDVATGPEEPTGNAGQPPPDGQQKPPPDQQPPGQPDQGSSPEEAQAISDVLAAFQKLTAARQADDLAAEGAAQAELAEALQRLAAARSAAPPAGG